MAEFLALKGQSVSYSALEYLAYSLNPHHTRPCATELFFLNYGILELSYWHCVSSTVLVTVVDDERILAKCFNADVDTIQKLKAGFALKT
ncbi:hypothetical protein PVK06_000866 [Gossypium arboreum]|uniref:Uncharacterized protein n=1 Tax=Gossypium arboreum TaxID=29729 RepID=A0ABR0QZG4_GOSAR|nr:hypothetical protein PVK06_000866 [Gossypium arboreum]